MSWKTEQDLAAIGVHYFRERGWAVYQEVAMGGRTVDFVATLGPVLWAVEVKRSRTISVLEQADILVAQAHRVSVLVPSRGSRFFERLAATLGIGVFVPAGRYIGGSDEWSLRERVAPTLRRRVATMLKRCLHDAQQDYCAAGTANGGRWSPWRDTMDRAVAYVKRNPGCTVRDIVEHVSHHYSTDSNAKQSIAAWLESSHFNDIRVELETKPRRVRRFYPVET